MIVLIIPNHDNNDSDNDKYDNDNNDTIDNDNKNDNNNMKRQEGVAWTLRAVENLPAVLGY